MKIIDIGICVNNNDPKHLGRIRCIRYSSQVGPLERAYEYRDWDDKDLFTANPFLPSNINYIPEVGQAVKIINYDTEKENANVEYVAGPFTTMHDYNSQTYSAQVEYTTYGIATKHGPDVIDKNGKFKNQKSKGAFAKNTDYGIYGKYGSDVLFTNGGLLLRGGKLLSKENASTNQRNVMISQPLMSEKSSNLYLKKYPKKLTLVDEPITTETIVVSDLKSIIEYSVDSFSGGTTNVNFYVYLITGKTNGDLYKTSNTSLNTTPLLMDKLLLISNDVTNNQPTLTIPATDINGVISIIRNTIKTIQINGNLSTFNITSPIPNSNESLHPFYFRPTEETKTRVLSNDEKTNRSFILSKITPYNNVGPENGLLFSKDSFQPPVVTTRSIKKVLKESNENSEQTFSALKSDKIYFISTDLNTNKIDFNKLDKYDLTQDNYLTDIEPNTYSLVRGESLLNFLDALYTTFLGHVHNINEPYAKIGYDPHIRMEELFKTLKNDILNSSIRIN